MCFQIAIDAVLYIVQIKMEDVFHESYKTDEFMFAPFLSFFCDSFSAVRQLLRRPCCIG
jgi:hypothetical protein